MLSSQHRIYVIPNSFYAIMIFQVIFHGVQFLVLNLSVSCVCQFSLVVECFHLYFAIVYCEPILAGLFLYCKSLW